MSRATAKTALTVSTLSQTRLYHNVPPVMVLRRWTSKHRHAELYAIRPLSTIILPTHAINALRNIFIMRQLKSANLAISPIVTCVKPLGLVARPVTMASCSIQHPENASGIVRKTTTSANLIRNV